MDNFSVKQGVGLFSQTLELWVAIDPCLPRCGRNSKFQLILSSPNGQTLLGNGECCHSSEGNNLFQWTIFPEKEQNLASLIAQSQWYLYLALQHSREPISFHALLASWEWCASSQMIVQNFLSLGQQQVPSWQKNFLRSHCYSMEEAF